MDMLCSRCKKRLAVVFMTRLEGDKTINEGLCLKCAKGLGLKQVDDIMHQMGISDEDLDHINDEMTDMLGQMLPEQTEGDEDNTDETDSQTATFPFLNKPTGARPSRRSHPRMSALTAPSPARARSINSLTSTA